MSVPFRIIALLLAMMVMPLTVSTGSGDADQAHTQGRALPDITIQNNVSVYPPVITGSGTTRVHIWTTILNVGDNVTGAFDVTVNVTGLTTGSVQTQSSGVLNIDPGNGTLQDFIFDLVTENYTFVVEADSTGRVHESDEMNNTVTGSIQANIAPVAVIAGPEMVATEVDKGILLDGTQSYDVDGTVGSYYWEMGDGNVSFSAIVIHTYKRGGMYNVTLTVSDEHGTRGTTHAHIKVDSPPRIFDWNPKGDASVNEGETLRFWVQAVDPEGKDISITWRHSGAVVANGPQYDAWFDYTSAGARTIEVEVSDGPLRSGRTWVVTVLDSVPLIVSQWPTSKTVVYEGDDVSVGFEPSAAAMDADMDWFLDGQWFSSGVPNATLHTVPGSEGEHTVRVEVWDKYMFDSATWSFDVRPMEAKPSIRWYDPREDAVTVNVGEPAWFSVGAEGGTPTWYEDGVIATSGPTLEITHPDHGVHKVSVVVTGGGTSVERVWALTVNGRPKAAIASGSNDIGVGGQVILSAHDSTDDAGIVGYEWTLGEGGSGKGIEVVKGGTEAGGKVMGSPEVTLRFTEPGAYRITLSVTDGQGETDMAEVTVVVRPEKEKASTPGFGASMAVAAMAVAALVLLSGWRVSSS